MTTTAYTADRTALLIVDPYNDFMSKGGKLYEAIRETAEAADALRYLVGLILVRIPQHQIINRVRCPCAGDRERTGKL